MAPGPHRGPRPLGWLSRRLLRRRVPVGTRDFGGPWDGGDDDGLSGDREPRRPLPPTGSMAAALDPPAGEE